jgi:predicted enzyme related to lactoylglutathione lyase
VRVSDVDAAAAAVRKFGGSVFEHTRTRLTNPDGSSMDFVYCTDPDGVRLELMRLPG